MTYKDGKINMKLDATNRDVVSTYLNVKSHDTNSYRLDFELHDECGNPLALENSKPRILLLLGDNAAQIFNLTVESNELGEAYFIVPERILGYEGSVKASVYVDYDDKTHDLGSFRFKMQRSDIDGELKGLSIYVEEFEDALSKMEEAQSQFNEASDKLQKRVEELEEKISETDLVRHPEFDDLEDEVVSARDGEIDLSTRLNREYRTQSGEISAVRTLIDNNFSKNHTVKVIGEVDATITDKPIMVATVDDINQNRFKIKKVGDV